MLAHSAPSSKETKLPSDHIVDTPGPHIPAKVPTKNPPKNNTKQKQLINESYIIIYIY